ncbi:MAG: hypothetical protein AB8B67_02525 [Rickettsiaceae bacterium]
MKTLKSLIRIHNNNIDELLLSINKLKSNQEENEGSIDFLTQEKLNEIDNYRDTKYVIDLSQYLERVERKLRDLYSIRANLARKIQMKQNELFVQFQEVKRLEIILKKKEQELRAELVKQEGKILDEFSINKFTQ